MSRGYRENFEGKDVETPDPFIESYPTPTAGDGKPVKNNLYNGGAQGRGSTKLKAKCRQCGFPNDISKIDHSGGTDSFQNAVSVSSTATANGQAVNVPGSTAVHTENYGNLQWSPGAGCALCGSKASTDPKVLDQVQQASNPQIPLGF